jgi:hypothetical protein
MSVPANLYYVLFAIGFTVAFGLAVSGYFAIYRFIQRQPDYSKPDKFQLYHYDRKNNLVETPLGKPYATVLTLWGEPDITIQEQQTIYRYWQIEYSYAKYADDCFYFTLWFDKDSGLCTYAFPDPIHRSNLPVAIDSSRGYPISRQLREI